MIDDFKGWVSLRLNFGLKGYVSRHYTYFIRTERQSARMSEIIKNGGSDQYGAEPFEQQQYGTAGVEGVNDLLI